MNYFLVLLMVLSYSVLVSLTANNNDTIQWIRTAQDTKDRLSLQKNITFENDFDSNGTVVTINRSVQYIIIYTDFNCTIHTCII